MHLTIGYFTGRHDSKLEWFADSLRRSIGDDNTLGVRIVVVDFWAQPMPGWPEEAVLDRKQVVRSLLSGFDFIYVAPKPTVWQGRFRLTKQDWFAASNARNTAVCLSPGDWIAFVDDLSVLLPGWLTRVREAMQHPRRITCGAYRKVKDLVVNGGTVTSFTDHPGGHDNRLAHVQGPGPHPCAGNWMYGCSLVAPVEAFLSINGFPEAWCDGMGFEDCVAGIMLDKKGYSFVYDPRMMTYESEELHHQLPVMKRSDYGVSPNDKSHAVLNAARSGPGWWHPNYFGEEGIRGLRARVLAGEPFPIVQIPAHEWFTSRPLGEL